MYLLLYDKHYTAGTISGIQGMIWAIGSFCGVCAYGRILRYIPWYQSTYARIKIVHLWIIAVGYLFWTLEKCRSRENTAAVEINAYLYLPPSFPPFLCSPNMCVGTWRLVIVGWRENQIRLCWLFCVPDVNDIAPCAEGVLIVRVVYTPMHICTCRKTLRGSSRQVPTLRT